MQCQPLFQALRFRRCMHHMKLYVWEQEAAMNLARLTSESSITSGNGLNLNVDGIYWPATVGWNTKSQSQNRGGGLLFFSAIPIYFSNSQHRGVLQCWGSCPDYLTHACQFPFDKDDRGAFVVFKKSKHINSRQSCPPPPPPTRTLPLVGNTNKTLKWQICVSATFS